MDTSFTTLLPYLQHLTVPTLWLADENALDTLNALSNKKNSLLHIATNRYDVYLLARHKNISAEYNDFTLEQLPQIPSRIIYRISKEKPLTHYLINRATQLLGEQGEFIISGQKQEGIKSYAENITKRIGCDGKLKKLGTHYQATFSNFAHHTALDDQNYPQFQQPFSHHPLHHQLYSKPGVFGWNKIDQGTELLLQSLPNILKEYTHSFHNILDLGCGYGWIFANLPHYLSGAALSEVRITATDNNATAISCAQKNALLTPLNIDIIADDCASNINEKFDLILCNPPFHQGFAHDKTLTQKFLDQTKRHLTTNGMAIFVVNEFIRLPKEQCLQFIHNEIFAKEHGFKIIVLR